jgi:predicted metal-dependent hydrolase
MSPDTVITSEVVNTKQRTCKDAPSGRVLCAIRQFNSQEWFECHETLEALWLQEQGEVRDFYQGVIQIAIALHHWRNGNFNGAMALLEGGAHYLKRVSSPCLWVDVTGLMEQATTVQKALQQLGTARMADLDQKLVPLITTVSA